MALFKAFRGKRIDLDAVEKHEGYAYFCIDDGTLFFDYLDENNILQRKQIALDSAMAEELLSQAKASGEFDGEDGYTPVRGTDYWTDADKAEIKSYVDDAILNGEW